MSDLDEDIPPVAKYLTRYLHRANELESVAPNVAFYILKYVVERLYELRSNLPINSPETTNDFNNYLLKILTRAEKLKEKVNKETGPLECRRFCLAVLDKADVTDRLASADSRTKLFQFYVSGLLLDVLDQFGSPDREIKEKRQYAKAKTEYIKNCIECNQVYNPDNYKELDFSEVSLVTNRTDALDSELRDTTDSSPHHSSLEEQLKGILPPTRTCEAKPSSSSSKEMFLENCSPTLTALNTRIQNEPNSSQILGSEHTLNEYSPTQQNIAASMKITRQALSALSFNDLTAARKCLQDALDLISRP